MANYPVINLEGAKTVEELVARLRPYIDQLGTALRTLSFDSNFKMFLWEGTIQPEEELRILHTLERIPTGRLLISHQGGAIVDGASRWTDTEVFLQNADSTVAAVARVLFWVDSNQPQRFSWPGLPTGGGGGTPILQYSSDPVSPAVEEAWVLRSGSGGGGGGGEVKSLFPLILSVGSGGGYTYQFSFRTKEGTTVRTTLAP